MSAIAPEQNLGTSKEVAAYLGVTPNALAQMRANGTGPEFIRLSYRNVRYDWQTVYDWLAARTHASTDEYAA